jgi:integrase
VEPNQAEGIALVWSGPFPLRTIAAPDAPPEAQAAGVYVWTARVGDEWWPYYIGETGKTFATRQREHLRLYHEGEYRVCEPRAFSEGRKVLLWPGAYGPQNRYKLPWFRLILRDIAPALEAFISLLNVFLIPVEMRLFLAAARSSPYYPMYCLGLGAGLHMAECLGLEWRDVDLVFGRVTVRHGKTPSRRRTISLPEFAREVLLTVSKDGPNDPVFLGGFAPQTVEDRVREDLRRYTNVKFHELRHSHATALLLAGEPLKVVSQRLGHSSIRLTADTYQHVLPGMDERAAARLDALLGKDTVSKM